MHELSVTQYILEIAKEQAKTAGKEKITKITISIGDLSGIEGDCIRFYFDEMKKGSIAEAALLDFTKVPVKLKCRKCNNEFIMDNSNPLWTCPKCQSSGIAIIDGKDCYVESIEVES